jgi:hypothetical protein
MDGAKVICDQSTATIDAKNGTTILNRGMLMIGNYLRLNNNSCLINEANAMLVVGGRIDRERGGIGSFSFQEITSRLVVEKFSYLISTNSKIINEGLIKQPPAWYTNYGDEAEGNIYNRKNGRTETH